MPAPDVAFGIEGTIDGILEHGKEFAGAATSAGFALLGLAVFFHLVEGAAELVKKKSCRWMDGMFYARLGFVVALLFGYQGLFFGLAQRSLPSSMKGFAESWTKVWVAQKTALTELREYEEQNQELKKSEVSGTKSSKEVEGGWMAKAVFWAVDGIVNGIGHALVGLLGFLLTVFLLMEGFWAVGVATLTLAIGPICVASLAHHKTDGAFWAFIRAFFVYAFVYTRLLHLAAGFAGVIMAQMTTMRQSAQVYYGDGTDVWVHGVIVLVGPLCAMAIVRSVNGTVTSLLHSGGSGSGSAFAGAVGVMQSGAHLAVGAALGGAKWLASRIRGGGGGQGGGEGGGQDGGGGKAAWPRTKNVRGG